MKKKNGEGYVKKRCANKCATLFILLRRMRKVEKRKVTRKSRCSPERSLLVMLLEMLTVKNHTRGGSVCVELWKKIVNYNLHRVFVLRVKYIYFFINGLVFSSTHAKYL